MPDVLVVGCRSTSTTTCGAVKKCTTKTLLCCRSVWVLCVPLWKEAGWGGYNQISISLWFLLSRQYVLKRISIWNETLYGCVLSQTGVTLEDWMTAFKVKVHRIQLRKWLWSLSFDLFNYFLWANFVGWYIITNQRSMLKVTIALISVSHGVDWNPQKSVPYPGNIILTIWNKLYVVVRGHDLECLCKELGLEQSESRS